MTDVKRLLSIDGGGIRGVMAAEILVQIEDTLRIYNPKWQCLADFFHLIGGTSTGSILAAGLAKGMSARELLSIYKKDGKQIFTKTWISQIPQLGRLFTKYNPIPLENKLQEVFGDMTLASPDLKTLLMIVTKNVTRGGTSIFASHDNNQMFKKDQQVKLRDLIRASSAAPTFFPPHQFEVAGQAYEFVDGGVSMYNNPAFQLFLEATKPPSSGGLGWNHGLDNLLLISIGTGFYSNKIPLGKIRNYNAIDWAEYIVKLLMDDANIQQNQILKLVGYQPNYWDKNDKKIIYKPASQALPDELKDKLFAYFRLTADFTKERLHDLGIADADFINIKALEQMDCVDEIETLSTVGKAVAQEQFLIKRLEPFLTSS